MLVLDNKCKKCNVICNSIHFQQDFINWTSGNNHIDNFIQNTQLLVHDSYYELFEEVVEWIPYDRLYDIECITKDSYNNIFKARWIDGYIYRWDNTNQNWKRNKQNIVVTLKLINNPASITLELIDEVL